MRGVSKSFGTGVWPRRRTTVDVLRDVDITVDAGEIVGVLGANGAGKTTLLHAIAGLLRPDSGSIVYNGEPMGASAARALVGVCSSADRSFYYRLTLRANLEFFGRLYGLQGARLARRISELLDLTDLREYEGRLYSRCSTGTRQRLGLARALLHDPPIVLLDEPTRAVDPLHALALRAFVQSQLARASRKVIVLATNSLEEAWSVCDRIVLLAGGRCIANDTPGGLERSFSKTVRYRVQLERPDGVLAQQLRMVGTVQSSSHVPEINIELGTGEHAFHAMLQILATSGTPVKALIPDGTAATDVFAAAVGQ